MTRFAIIGGAFLLLGGMMSAWAQPDSPPGTNPNINPMSARLSAERVGEIEAGIYSAGDSGNFVLQPYNGRYLLRFENGSENFVLSMEHSSLGAKILKYDTGTVAIRVSVWGGMTLYPQDAPSGVPATRVGDAPVEEDGGVTQPELQAAMGDETSHMGYVQKVSLKFAADPSVMAADPETRSRAFDALINAAQGIERFLGNAAARLALTRRVNTVKVTEGARPTVLIAGRTLLVSFVPGEGHEGHASSFAIQQELGKLLSVTPKDVAVK